MPPPRPRLPHPLRTALLALAVAAASLLGSAPRAAASADDTPRQVLRIGIGAEPKTVDPHVATGIPESKVITALMEGLVGEHPSEDTTIVPGVAERWEKSADGLTYTFHLRADARWSNGDPVTAGDFAYAWSRILNPEFTSEYASMLYPLENAEGYHRRDDPALPPERRISDFSKVGVRVIDPRTLQLRLRAPLPYFLQLLRHYSWFPIHRPTIERFDAFARSGTRWTDPASHVGNGPFTLHSWVPNQGIVVRRNPSYWDAASVRLDEIHFLGIDSANSEENAFLAGQIHATDSVPFPSRKGYLERRDPRFHRDLSLATTYLIFNVARPAVSDPRVRRALALAVDRDSIITNLTRAGTPAGSFTPPMPGYEPPWAVDFDPAAARALLAEAGFPGGRGLPRITLSITTADTTRVAAEAIQAMWVRHLGIDVAIQNMEWKVFLSNLTRRDYDVGFLSWWGDYVDPFTFLEVFRSGSGNNRSGWTSTAYDALLASSELAADPAERADRMRQAEELLLTAMPIAPLWHGTHNYLLHPSVRNFFPKLLDQRPWKAVYLDPLPAASR